MPDETKVIDVFMGPYRGHRLTVSAADADSAVNNHWATDANAGPPAADEEPHPPLSDEERQAALDAAHEWANKTWATAQGVEPDEPPPEPPPEGEVARDMAADDPARYATRSAPRQPPRRR
jgi:hypothetical protein